MTVSAPVVIEMTKRVRDEGHWRVATTPEGDAQITWWQLGEPVITLRVGGWMPADACADLHRIIGLAHTATGMAAARHLGIEEAGHAAALARPAAPVAAGPRHPEGGHQ